MLQVNYRGSTGFGFQHYDAARQNFGSGILNDIIDATQWAVESGVADRDRIAILGASYGGYATLMALTREPDLFRCGVAIAGVYNLRKQMVDYVAGGRGGYLAYEYWKSMVADAKKNREQMDGISPINQVAAIANPIFVIHGEHDRVVSIGQSQALVRELKKAGKQHRYLPVKESGHGGWEEKYNVKVHDEILAFLEENLR